MKSWNLHLLVLLVGALNVLALVSTPAGAVVGANLDDDAKTQAGYVHNGTAYSCDDGICYRNSTEDPENKKAVIEKVNFLLPSDGSKNGSSGSPGSTE
jgi:hypothetical protein